MRRVTSVFCLMALLLLSACWGPSNEQIGTGGINGYATTADYRVITKLHREPTDTNGIDVVCEEPSPDIAKAYSQALSLSGGNGTVNAAVQYQTAQAIAQLGKRYATVQLLRDMLHGDCLDYANGAIGKIEYQFRLSRFDDLVVTLLGIEMVTGDAGDYPPAVNSPALTVVNSGSGGTTVHNGSSTSGTADKASAQQNATDQRSSGTAGDSSASDGSSTSDDGTSTSQQPTNAKIAAATIAVHDADTAVEATKKALGSVPNSPDPSVAAVKTAASKVSAAGNEMDKVWGEFTKATGAPPATFSDDVSALDKAVKTLAGLPGATVTASKIVAVKTAGSTVTTAVAALEKADKAIDDLVAKKSGSGPAGKTTKSAQGAISDQQAKTVGQMQENFLERANLSPYGIACFEALDRTPWVRHDN